MLGKLPKSDLILARLNVNMSLQFRIYQNDSMTENLISNNNKTDNHLIKEESGEMATQCSSNLCFSMGIYYVCKNALV